MRFNQMRDGKMTYKQCFRNELKLKLKMNGTIRTSVLGSYFRVYIC